ncbi:MAG: Crp/Fnr family transcriptional regulator [Rhodospirillales bacterium]|jgi:CRP-like cAMP-binding protein|nr:Crp/Fnr family transcriptional regulator [Rhodospirillales bacterium]
MSEHNDKFERKTFEKDDTIFEEGQPGNAAYLVVSGKVDIGLGLKGEAPRVLASVGKGKVIGEMALFDKHPRMASAVATEKTEAIRISRDEFRGRMKMMDPVMRSILKLMVKRTRELSEQVAELKRTDWHSN